MPTAKATYSAGTAYLTVTPSFLGVEAALKRQLGKAAAAADKDIAAAVARGLRDANKQARGTGSKGGRDYAGAYADEARKVLTKAWQQLPQPQPDVNLRKWDKALAGVRADMKELSEQRIGIDIDRATFDRAVDNFRRRLEELRDTASGPNKEIGFFNAAQSARQLDELKKFTSEAVRRAARGGEQTGSAFAERMSKALRDGLTKIPDLKVGADATEAERKIAELRGRMQVLQDQNIGVDIDASAAYAELRAITQQLQRLDRTSVRVDIRTNAHEASAGMAAFVKQAEEAGRATERIGQRANFSLSRLEYLIALGVSLGTSIVPAAGAAAAAIGFIGTSAIASMAGVGVMALGLSGVGEAVKALNGYAEDQQKSADNVASANRRVAASTEQVRMAQLGLANARRQVAEAAQDAARRVADAERDVASARRQASRELEDAARAVRDARRSVRDAEKEVADVRQRVAQDLVSAQRQIRDAQRGVTDAEKDALDIRRDLNDALREAKRSMEELDVELDKNAADQKRAVADQMEALEELNALKMNPRATEAELLRAQAAYDEQTARIKELQLEQKKMAEDKNRYAKEGVEGDERVIAARRRLAEADERVERAREKLADEQRERREAELDGQRAIGDAQERVARAQEQVTRALVSQRDTEIDARERIAEAERDLAVARGDQQSQRADGEYQIAQASNALADAQRSQAEAWQATETAGGSALEKLNEEMSDLSPVGQDFARFLFGLKDEVTGLRDAAADPLLPSLEDAITLLLPYLPSLEKFIGKVAGAMGDLSIKTAEALGSPVWQRFFSYVDRTAVPTLNTLWEVGNNLTQGMISLYLALTPFNKDIGGGLVQLSRDFAEWAERLNRTEGYQAFLDYVRENGPKVVKFLGEVGELFIDLVKAAAPVGSVVLSVLTVLVDVLNSIPDEALTALVVGLAAAGLGFTVLGGIMRAIKLREQLTDIFGPRTQSMVQRFAYDTGRATTETGKFATATAAMHGVVATGRDRVVAFGGAVRDLGGHVRDLGSRVGGPVLTGMSTLSQKFDGARVAALTTATAITGPGGMAAALQTGKDRIVGLAAAGEVAARQGMSQFRTALTDIAVAANGPGGVAAGAQTAAAKVGALATVVGGPAATKMGAFAGKAKDAAHQIGTKLMQGASSLSGFLGGPWGVALVGATAVVATLSSASADYNGKIDSLVTSLDELGRQYQELKDGGKTGTAEATQLLSDIVQRNPEMQKAVLNLDAIGVSIEDIGKAAAGSKEDLDAVLRSIDEEIVLAEQKWQDEANFLFTVFSDDAQKASDRLAQLRQLRDAVGEHADKATVAAEIQKILNEATDDAKTSVQFLTPAEKALADAHQVMSDKASTAEEKFNALTKAQDVMRQSQINAIEAEEDFAEANDNLRDSVNAAKDAHVKSKDLLNLHTAAGRSNRDMLKNLIEASNRMYDADVALNGVTQTAIDKGQGHINKIRETAKQLGLNKTETEKLITAYRKIPENLETAIKLDDKSFVATYRNLQKMQWMQTAMRLNLTPEQAEAMWKRTDYPKGSTGYAEGGEVHGPGTGKSDSVVARLSRGEWVQPVEAVDYYGDDFMEAVRKREIPRESLPGYAAGGQVEKLRVNFPIDVKKTFVPSKANLEDYLWGSGSGALGDAKGGQGWRWQMAVLRAVFPGLALFSGYRPGAITSSGNRSWHGIDGGRAVDVPPQQKVFNWIHDTYGKGTKELIWGGDPDRNIQRGKHHRYSDSLLRAHGPYQGKKGPSPHVHWAYDEGGMLPPGYSMVYNGTGSPEPVLTDQQWTDITKLAQAAANGRSGNNYEFHFRDTTLDEGRLRAIQDREAVLAREGRSR